MVGETQQAFIGRIQILDASLIANEIVDAALNKGTLGLVSKLGIEKHMIKSPFVLQNSASFYRRKTNFRYNFNCQLNGWCSS